MKQVILNGEELQSREALHGYLERVLSLPEWYGHNLDALYDCLTGELTEETTLTLRNLEALLSSLGGYGTVFLRMLREAEEENPLLHLDLPDDYGEGEE